MAAPDRSWTLQRTGIGEKVAVFPSVTRSNLIFLGLIVIFGVATAVLHHRAPDLMGEDVFYADAAQNLLRHGFYGVNGNPETTQPPGLPAILALLISIFGYSYGMCVAVMAVFETLGFLLA